MPHVALLALSGVRLLDEELLSLGLTLPGLRERSQAIAELPALGLLTLAGVTDETWTQSYHTATTFHDAVLHQILLTRPALVAISALTASINTAYDYSRRLKAEGILTAVGGLHASACPDEAARHCDAVCIGDGESVWAELLADVKAGRLKPHYQSKLWRFAESNIIPRWELLNSNRLPRYTMQTQRGCPLACSFCAASRLLGPFREKPVDAIEEELRAIRVHAGAHRPLVELADDNTFAGARNVEEFARVFGESGVRFFTESDWRIGERPEVYQQLYAAGCRQILIGIESLVFRYPGMGDKVAELGRMISSVNRLQEHGVAVNGCFIVGGDGETRVSMERLGEFLERSPFADIQLTLQTPFPGTALYHQLARQSRLRKPPDDWSACTLFDVAYQPDRISQDELRDGFRDLIARVYSRSAADRRRRIRWKISREARHETVQKESRCEDDF